MLGKDRRDSLAGWILYLTVVQPVLVGTINDEDCDLQGPSSVAGWLAGHRFGPLCGLVASGHSEFACRWHVHSTADTWNNISASSVLVAIGARTQIEWTWPNGPMVDVGHVTANSRVHRLLTFDTRGLFPDSMGTFAHGAMSMSHEHSRCRDKSSTCLLSARPSSTR